MADISLPNHQLSLFYSQFKLRRFDDSTLRILELILSSKDVKLSLEFRSKLKEFLRLESLIAIREASGKSVEHKLLILDFLVRAFAIVDDVESCLAVRYEGLVMRDSWTTSHPDLRVSCSEWMNFAEDAFNNDFYSVTAKACKYAILCLNVKSDFNCDNLSESASTINRIQRLKDTAIRLSSCHSEKICRAVNSAVQNISPEHLEQSSTDQGIRNISISSGASHRVHEKENFVH